MVNLGSPNLGKPKLIKLAKVIDAGSEGLPECRRRGGCNRGLFTRNINSVNEQFGFITGRVFRAVIRVRGATV